jgi:hypothetical protein
MPLYALTNEPTKEPVMKHAVSRRRHNGKFCRVLAPLVVVCLLLALGIAAAGCGGGSSSATSATTAGATATTAGTATGTMSGTDLGKAVAALWTEAMQKLDTLLADEPSSDTVKDQVSTLKEEYVQKLVALGKQRQAMDTAAQAEADAAITSALAAAASADYYATYMDHYDHYSYASGDVDFVNMVGSFNILTQYANFDLLKKQDAAEATRLGIQ